MVETRLTRKQHIALHFLSENKGKVLSGLPDAVKEIQNKKLIRRVIGFDGFDGSSDAYVWGLTEEGERVIAELGAPNPMYQMPTS